MSARGCCGGGAEPRMLPMRHGSASGKGPPATNAQPRWQATHTHKCHDHPLPMRCIATAQSSCRRTVCCAELSRPPLAAPARPIEPTRLGWLWFLRCPRSASSLSAHPLWLAQTSFGVSIRSIVASHWSSDAEPLAGRAAAAAAAAAGRDGSLRNEKAAMSSFARSSREPPDRQLPNRKRNSGQHEGKLCGVSAS